MKKLLMLTIGMLFVLSTVCFADHLPDSEFALGGISIKGDVTIDYVRSIYGEPQVVKRSQHGAEYSYGDTVIIRTSMLNKNHIECVRSIQTTANNGFSTPSGLSVGMTVEDMLDMYGSPRSEGVSKDGGTRYIYGDKYRSGSVGIFIETNNQGIITMIKMG